MLILFRERTHTVIPSSKRIVYVINSSSLFPDFLHEWMSKGLLYAHSFRRARSQETRNEGPAVRGKNCLIQVVVFEGLLYEAYVEETMQQMEMSMHCCTDKFFVEGVVNDLFAGALWRVTAGPNF